MRLKILRVIIFSFLLVIAADLVYLQAIRGPYYHSLSVNNRIRVIPLQARRGTIMDRNGVVLADNRLSFNVTVIPQDVQDKERLFDYLSGALKVDKEKLLRRFYEKKVTPFAPVVIVDDVDRRVAMMLEENRFRFPGLYIQQDFRRLYPFEQIGAHVLGYVGQINRSKMEKLKDYGYTPQSMVGYSGIEEYYDAYLVGKEGGQQIEVNSRGQQVRLLSTRDPEAGQDIQLTIDERIQTIAHDVLGERNGAVVVMDVESGEILGMVSYPAYDPNIFTDSKKMKQAHYVFTDPASPLLNRAVMGQYPPGSVFKAVVTTAGLISKKVSPYTTFFCKGAYYLGRRRFRCTHQHGTQNLIEAIGHSCNVYFYNVGLLTGPDPISKYARVYGLGALTHVDLPFEEKGFIPSRMTRKKQNRGWYKGDTLNFSIGQGEVLATPLQLVRMMASIARRGSEVQPHLIRQIGGKDIIHFSSSRDLNIPDKVFDVLHMGLRSVVTDSGGTARQLNMEDYIISGKTGTAQSVPGKKEHAWFVGYTRENPTNVAFCVFLEHGGSSYYAVSVAKEFFRRIKEEGIL